MGTNVDLALEAFYQAVEDASRARRRASLGGQQVSFHGDFASAPPSTLSQLEWYVRLFQAAQEEDKENL